MYSNAVIIRDNTWAVSCGATASAAAIEFDATNGETVESSLIGNLIEVTNYVYGVRLDQSAQVFGSHNTFWDANPARTLYAYYLAGPTIGGSFTCDSCALPFPQLGVTFQPVGDFAGNTNGGRYDHGIYMSGTYDFNGGGSAGNAPAVRISPDPKSPSEANALFGIFRSQSDPISPNATIFSVTQGGTVTVQSATGDPSVAIHGTSSQLTVDQNTIVLNSGSLGLYAGAAGNAVNIARGDLMIGQGVASDGNGMKHRRLSTGSIPATGNTDVTFSWASTLADANYTVSCSVIEATGVLTANIKSVIAASVVVNVKNTSAGALTGTLDCIAMHD